MKLIYAKDLQQMLAANGITASVQHICTFAQKIAAEYTTPVGPITEIDALHKCITEKTGFALLSAWLHANPEQAGAK